MARDSDDSDRTALHRPDAEHYRQAAESALDQLDWCIAYFRRINKGQLASALARNRAQIREQLR